MASPLVCLFGIVALVRHRRLRTGNSSSRWFEYVVLVYIDGARYGRGYQSDDQQTDQWTAWFTHTGNLGDALFQLRVVRMIPDQVCTRAAVASRRVLLHHVTAVSAKNDFQQQPPARRTPKGAWFRLRVSKHGLDVKLNFLNIWRFRRLIRAKSRGRKQRVKSWGKPQVAKYSYPGESVAGIL